MAVLPLDIPTKFMDKRIIYLINDELATDNTYITIFIDDYNRLWFQRKDKFFPFSEIESTILYEFYIYLLLDEDVAPIFEGMDLHTSIETYLQVLHGNMRLEQELDNLF